MSDLSRVTRPPSNTARVQNGLFAVKLVTLWAKKGTKDESWGFTFLVWLLSQQLGLEGGTSPKGPGHFDSLVPCTLAALEPTYWGFLFAYGCG